MAVKHVTQPVKKSGPPKAKQVCRHVLTDAERAIIRPVEILPLREWAEKHRRVTSGPMVGPGGGSVPWSNAVDPLGVAIMDALDDERWSRVVLMGSPQRSSKTELAINLALSTLHQRRANVFYHNASFEAAQDVLRKKLLPAVLASDSLKGLIPEDREEQGVRGRRDMSNGTAFFVRGSESRAALAQATAMVTIGDDLQAMRVLPEGDHPADLAMERADAYPVSQRRHLHIGQPGQVDDYLARELFDSTFYLPFTPCPECGTYQLLEWDRFVFDAEDPDAARLDCGVACCRDDCARVMRDADLPGMLAAHRWVSCPPGVNWVLDPMAGGTWVDLDRAAVYPATDRKTTVCGFWRSAFTWAFTSFGSLAVQWIGCKGKPEEEINFQKRIRAVPYKPPEVDEEALQEGEVAEHQGPTYHAGEVPDAADLVVATVDVQSGYVYYIVRAWNKSTGDSWLIDLGTSGKPITSADSKRGQKRDRALGITAALDGLQAEWSAGWPVQGGSTRMNLTRVAIDQSFESDTVGAWVAVNGRGVWRLIRGLRAGMAGGMWPARLNVDGRGHRFRRVDVNQAKHLVRHCLRVMPEQPGYWHMPAEGIHNNTVRAYLRHMTSEVYDRTRKTPGWVPKQPGVANHYWDCEVYQICLAVGLRVNLPSLPVQARERRNLADFAGLRSVRG